MNDYKKLFLIAEHIHMLDDAELDRINDCNTMDMTENQRKRLEYTIKEQYSLRRMELLFVLETVFQLSKYEIDYLYATQFERGDAPVETRIAEYLLKCSGTSLADISNGQY